MTDARIVDRGYRPYDGPRLGTRGAVRTLVRHTVERVLGLRRSGWAKVLPVLGAAIAYVPAVVFVGITALVPDERLRDLILPSYGEYYGFITSALVLFAAFVAPEALCPDRRTGLLGLYLAAPLTRTSYLGAKVAAVYGLVLVTTLGPPLLLLVANVLQGVGPAGVGDLAVLAGRVVVSGLVVGAVYTAVPLGIASLTAKRALAAAGVLSVIVISGAVTGALHEWGGAPDWVLAFNLTAAPFELVRRIYGEAGALPGVPTAVLAATTAGYTVAGFGLAWWRYQRVEVTR